MHSMNTEKKQKKREDLFFRAIALKRREYWKEKPVAVIEFRRMIQGGRNAERKEPARAHGPDG